MGETDDKARRARAPGFTFSCYSRGVEEKQKIIVIVGPTASGKTALAIRLAKEFGGEVISADSRQVYCGLDIGTEKATEKEMNGVPHHLIDIADANVPYSAAMFAHDATEAVREIAARGHVPIVAGGTFFYVDALVGNVALPAVPPNDALRAKLEARSPADLHAELAKRDPERAAVVDPQNKRRLVRALEIVESLGKVPSLEITPETKEEQKFDVLMLGIATDREALRARIRARAEEALERGLVEETEHLLESGVKEERLREIGLEYRLVLDHLSGSFDTGELLQRLGEKNWQYARRQLMWLKRYENIEWIDPTENERIAALVREFLSKD